jgi:hypothetical protein
MSDLGKIARKNKNFILMHFLVLLRKKIKKITALLKRRKGILPPICEENSNLEHSR